MLEFDLEENLYEICGEYKVPISYQMVKIRILRDKNNIYHYELSHSLMRDTEPHMFMSNDFEADSKEKALELALEFLQYISTFATEENVEWVLNEMY